MHGRAIPGLTALLALFLASCGDVPAPMPTVPAWAKVAPEQIAEAKRHGVPVAFENDLGMLFVLIPAGTFVMGSPEDETGRGDDETRHEITIGKPFYMSIHEVTNAQYRRIRPRHDSGSFEGVDLEAGDLPVSSVVWTDARSFGSHLAQHDGERIYRLPREAEWEYACRAGTASAFVWGDEIEGGRPFVNGWDAGTNRQWPWERETLPWDDGHRGPAPVGSFDPNPWGLHDMHGNVREWCEDRYAPYPQPPVLPPYSDTSLPAWNQTKTGPPVTRGGSWASRPMNLRSAYRHRLSEWSGLSVPYPGDLLDVGFRLVAELPESGEGGR